MNKITLKDMALKLNLSVSTVSRALHDHPGISEKTKDDVKSLSKKWEYQPNYLARGLQTRKTKVVGILVPEIRHYFFSAVISGIEEVMYKKGYAIMVCQSHEDPMREAKNLEAFISHQIAGLLISISQNTKSKESFETVFNRGIPLVFFDRVLESMRTSRVVVNDRQGGFDATEHLIKSGYQRIGFIGGPKHLNINRNRMAGYKMAQKKFNRPIEKELVVFTGLNEKDGVEGAYKLLHLQNRPDAILCINDPVAMGVYSVLKEQNLKIPNDVAVVGFSDNPVSKMQNPTLTTVSQPAYEMGLTAANLLLEQINSPIKIKQKVITLDTKLIIRGST